MYGSGLFQQTDVGLPVRQNTHFFAPLKHHVDAQLVPSLLVEPTPLAKSVLAYGACSERGALIMRGNEAVDALAAPFFQHTATQLERVDAVAECPCGELLSVGGTVGCPAASACVSGVQFGTHIGDLVALREGPQCAHEAPATAYQPAKL